MRFWIMDFLNQATAHRYICNNLNYLAFTVRPNEPDFNFLSSFLNSPSLKALIDVSFG